MSLFGKMAPIGKDLPLAPEEGLLADALREGYRYSPDMPIYEETLRFLYDHLEVMMFFEILCHFAGQIP
jgi:hypothetical protein